MTVSIDRSLRGALSYQAGLSAEMNVVRDYQRRGYTLEKERWRGKSGEIDLILRNAGELIFVEVKHSKSFERAAQRVSRRQMQRIYQSAEEFVATQPRGSLTPVRFDVALVDLTGDVQILENAFGHD